MRSPCLMSHSYLPCRCRWTPYGWRRWILDSWSSERLVSPTRHPWMERVDGITDAIHRQNLWMWWTHETYAESGWWGPRAFRNRWRQQTWNFLLYLFVTYCRWPLCFSTWQALKQRLSAGGGMEVGAMGLRWSKVFSVWPSKIWWWSGSAELCQLELVKDLLERLSTGVSCRRRAQNQPPWTQGQKIVGVQCSHCIEITAILFEY